MEAKNNKNDILQKIDEEYQNMTPLLNECFKICFENFNSCDEVIKSAVVADFIVNLSSKLSLALKIDDEINVIFKDFHHHFFECVEFHKNIY
jgi:hypothetical protein